MVTMERTRQEGLVDEAILTTPIHIVGAGGVGSLTTLAFGKVGFSDISVIDFDKVEVHNLPNQFYTLDSVGTYKVVALQEIIEAFTGTVIKTDPTEFTRQPFQRESIVVSAVDNMTARKNIFEHAVMDKTRGFIDGRMGGNQLEVYSVDMRVRMDKKVYRDTLWPEEETAHVRCTERAVMYNVLTIASWIVNQARLILMNKPFMRMLTLDLENMILLSQGMPDDPLRNERR